MERSGWTAIVVNYNGASFLGPCLMALERTSIPPSTIMVVDNASTDDSLIELHAFPRVQPLVQSLNLGFAGGANAGLSAVETEYAVILNPDVEVAASFGSALIAAFDRHPDLGAAGTLLTYPGQNRIQHAGGIVERPLMTTRHHGYGSTDLSAFEREMDVEFVTGGAIGLRLAAAMDIGGFDERFSPVYYEDVDLCVRLRQNGSRVMLIPSLRAEHHEGVTLQRQASYFRHLHRNRIRFALKHLSHAEWSLQFVPAELARLRHALAGTSGAADAELSGAAAIEAVLRDVDGSVGWNMPAQMTAWPEPAFGIDAARSLAEVSGTPLRSRIPLVGWLRSMINDLGPRWYVDPGFQQQSQFNAAVVQALESHERLHREQTAALLLIALDALGRFNQFPDRETDGWPEESTLER